MKAQIYVNRHKMAANKKATKETGTIVDEPAISVNTYKGSIYCKEVELPPGAKLIQNAEAARCSGATIWLEVEDFESLIIDGQRASRSMYEKEEILDIEDYFWQFVEDFKANKNNSYTEIARRLNSKYAADKQALQIMFKELEIKLTAKLNREELKSSFEDFEELTASIVGLGRKRYYSVLKNPKSAMYLTDPIKSCYTVLNLLEI